MNTSTLHPRGGTAIGAAHLPLHPAQPTAQPQITPLVLGSGPTAQRSSAKQVLKWDFFQGKPKGTRCPELNELQLAFPKCHVAVKTLVPFARAPKCSGNAAQDMPSEHQNDLSTICSQPWSQNHCSHHKIFLKFMKNSFFLCLFFLPSQNLDTWDSVSSCSVSLHSAGCQHTGSVQMTQGTTEGVKNLPGLQVFMFTTGCATGGTRD